MSDEPEDIAEFQLFVVDANGDEEMFAGCSGPRVRALYEILSYWRQVAGQERRLYEIIRVPVDLSKLANAPMFILPGDAV